LVMDHEKPEIHDLEYEPLCEQELLLLTAPRHALARKGQVTAADLVRYPIITTAEPSPNRTLLDRLLRKHRLSGKAHLLMEAGNYHLILRYVALGLGVSLLYLPAQDRLSLPGVHARVFSGEWPAPPVALVVRKHAHLPAHVTAFRALLRRHVAHQV